MSKPQPIHTTRILKALSRVYKKLPKKTDPVIRGTIIRMARVCGRKNCRCQRGFKHRSLYLSWSVKGKLKMVYIPKDAEEAVKKGVLNYKRVKVLLNRLSRIHLGRLKGGRLP